MNIQEREAKSILVTSKLPGADYVINPYTGCAFSCLYCFASFMGRQVGESIENWGNYVYAKTNAVSLLEQELRRWSAEKRRARLLISSVTDPYQGIERTYRLTRGILQVLANEQYPGLVGILTKSPLVLDDVDILRRLPNTEVGLTVTTTDNNLSRFMEVRAPLASRRLETLSQLHEEGITTYAFVGPLFPHFRYYPEQLEALFAALAEVKVGSIFVEHINLSSYIRRRLWEELQHEPKEIQDIYRGATTSQHRDTLQSMVMGLVEKYQLPLQLDTVIAHKDIRTEEKQQDQINGS